MWEVFRVSRIPRFCLTGSWRALEQVDAYVCCQQLHYRSELGLSFLQLVCSKGSWTPLYVTSHYASAVELASALLLGYPL